MNKKEIISSVILVGSFCLVHFAFGQSIENYGPSDFSTLFKGIADTVGTMIASVATIMFIVAGIYYLTSAGNPGRIETAKKILIYAIAGIVIGLGAKSIVDMVSGWVGST